MAEEIVSVKTMQKRNSSNTMSMTVIADQVADADELMHRVMLLTLNGNHYFLE